MVRYSSWIWENRCGKPIEFDQEHFKEQLNRLAELAGQDSEEIRDVVAEIVPTYIIASKSPDK